VISRLGLGDEEAAAAEMAVGDGCRGRDGCRSRYGGRDRDGGCVRGVVVVAEPCRESPPWRKRDEDVTLLPFVDEGLPLAGVD
jgi:hypothetical protein